MPPLPADFTHTRVCKPFCEKYLTLPVDPVTGWQGNQGISVDPVTGWQGNQGIRKSPLRDLPREMNAVGRPIFGPLRDFASIMSF